MERGSDCELRGRQIGIGEASSKRAPPSRNVRSVRALRRRCGCFLVSTFLTRLVYVAHERGEKSCASVPFLRVLLVSVTRISSFPVHTSPDEGECGAERRVGRDPDRSPSFVFSSCSAKRESRYAAKNRRRRRRSQRRLSVTANRQPLSARRLSRPLD